MPFRLSIFIQIEYLFRIAGISNNLSKRTGIITLRGGTSGGGGGRRPPPVREGAKTLGNTSGCAKNVYFPTMACFPDGSSIFNFSEVRHSIVKVKNSVPVNIEQLNAQVKRKISQGYSSYLFMNKTIVAP